MIRINDKEIEQEVNRELLRIETVMEDRNKLDSVTSDGRIPHLQERQLSIFQSLDRATTSLIIRLQGKNYRIDLTEIT